MERTVTELDPDTELSALTKALGETAGDGIATDPAGWPIGIGKILGALTAYVNRLAEQADNTNLILAETLERVAALESRE